MSGLPPKADRARVDRLRLIARYLERLVELRRIADRNRDGAGVLIRVGHRGRAGAQAGITDMRLDEGFAQGRFNRLQALLEDLVERDFQLKMRAALQIEAEIGRLMRQKARYV